MSQNKFFKDTNDIIRHLVDKYPVGEYTICMLLQNKELGSILVFEGENQDSDHMHNAYVMVWEETKEMWRLVDNENARKASIYFFAYFNYLSESLNDDDTEADFDITF